VPCPAAGRPGRPPSHRRRRSADWSGGRRISPDAVGEPVDGGRQYLTTFLRQLHSAAVVVEPDEKCPGSVLVLAGGRDGQTVRPATDGGLAVQLGHRRRIPVILEGCGRLDRRNGGPDAERHRYGARLELGIGAGLIGVCRLGRPVRLQHQRPGFHCGRLADTRLLGLRVVHVAAFRGDHRVVDLLVTALLQRSRQPDTLPPDLE